MSFGNKLKLKIARVLLDILKRVPQRWKIPFIEKIERNLQMAVLYRTDRLTWIAENLKLKGVRFGENCRFFTREFSSEPYLVEIGNNVCVASGTQFITHDGGTWLFYDWQNHTNDRNFFGKIKVGNNCFIGINCIILPGVEIGDNCVIGAGSVVRGSVPNDSVVMGNPAKVVMKTSLYEKMIKANKNYIKADLYNISTNSQKDLIVQKHFGISSAMTETFRV